LLGSLPGLLNFGTAVFVGWSLCLGFSTLEVDDGGFELELGGVVLDFGLLELVGNNS